MKDSAIPQSYKKKRSHSTSDSESSETTSDSDQGSFHLSKATKTKSPERIEISSDSESSPADVRRPRKKKKHKQSDVDDVHLIHDSRNGKHHRHRCHHHHHHHHSHHRHHKVESTRDREERTHKRTCYKHRMTLEGVRVKEEPSDNDNDRMRRSHSSHKRTEQRRERSEDQLSRRDQYPETSTGIRARHDRRENSYHRKVENDNKNERTSSKEMQSGERRSKEPERAEGGANKDDRRNRPQGRRNRWGNDEESTFNANRPIKQEPNDESQYEWGKKTDAAKDAKKVPPGQKDKPNFGLSGKLAEDTNVYNGVVIKYSEPPEARKPKRRWRFYPFKGDQGLPTLYIHRQSSYLIGRDRKVADIPVDHPSCSKQHAALQYRLVPFERDDGSMGKRVRPYIIDLESANGTFVNNVKVEAKTYVELLEKDVIKFGYSSREYVLLHEQSKEEELDDDVTAGGDSPT